MKTYLLLLFLFLFKYFVISQTPIVNLPGLKQIKAYEVTGGYFSHNFEITDYRLFKRLGTGISIANDFGGVPGEENYDIYFSDSNGNLDSLGAYITIECKYLGTSGGGGGNIAQLELEFNNGLFITPNKLSSFYNSGNNYIPGSELKTIDCDPTTFSTLGNISGNPSVFLRLTFDFTNIIQRKSLNACTGDGFVYMLGNNILNEINPSGYLITSIPNRCKTLEVVEINFEPLIEKIISYSGCPNDLFSITLGGETFDSQNPTGMVIIPSLVGCDTLIKVELDFTSIQTKNIKYVGCMGDEYSLKISDRIFDELNPTGIVFVNGESGCDTIYNIFLEFNPIISKIINYKGCQGDMYSVSKGNSVFNEQNPIGQVVAPAITGCDTLYTVNLAFESTFNKDIRSNRCKGDGFYIKIGNEIFNENNPTGIATIKSSEGCDTIASVYLSFYDCEECKIIHPNIISLSSTKNNLFSITLKEDCEYRLPELRIYSRWGNLVYKSSELFWDGTINGKKCETDVYTFIVTITIFNNLYTKYGTITVLK